MIQCQFKPQKDDYIKTIRYYYRRQMWWFIFFMLYGLAQSFCILSATLEGRMGIIGYFLVLLFCLILVVLPYLVYIVGPRRAGKRVEKDEVLGGTQVYTFTEENITITTPIETTTSEWGIFTKYLENEDYFLLFLTYRKNMFYILPKRSFDSEENINTFRDLLKEKSLNPQPRTLSLEGLKENKLMLLILLMAIPGLLTFICAFAALIFLTLTD